MSKETLIIENSPPLQGEVLLSGAKNATLVIIASLILTKGVSILRNVPDSTDVQYFIKLLGTLGAQVTFDGDEKILTVDTSNLSEQEISAQIMNSMRASILVMGPLLARFGKARVALPGGDLIGARPIGYHLKGLQKFGVKVSVDKPFVTAWLAEAKQEDRRICLEYPSVGATENILMYAVLHTGVTYIVNAAIEPEVLDLIEVLTKMGADVECLPGAIIKIIGVTSLKSIDHAIIPDRMEAGSLMLAAAMTGGSVTLPNARADHLDLFIEKLREIGHAITVGTHRTGLQPLLGIAFKSGDYLQPVKVKTGPYPSFPTDLQALLMAHLCLIHGTSTIEETVFENRFIHVTELQKMGAQISVSGRIATIRGVEQLYGANVIASDIRASCSLVLAGLAAEGKTIMTGVEHWKRGYDHLEKKLKATGAIIDLQEVGASGSRTLGI